MDPSYLRRGLIRPVTASRSRSSSIGTTRRLSRNLRSVFPQKKIRIQTTSLRTDLSWEFQSFKRRHTWDAPSLRPPALQLVIHP